MGMSTARTLMPVLFSRLACGTALSCVFLLSPLLATTPVVAQDAIGSYQTNPDARMLLQSDELIYDRDANTVVAQGNVQIEYDGNKLVAERVTYNQATRRMTASGKVEIVERDGNRIYGDQIDITDDFRDGFVNGLRVETVDDTRFVAESAERSTGQITTFNSGVYTACQACSKDPNKPVLWQIKARKIIWNGATKNVRFERGRFEFLGIPIAYLPAFEMADPTVKRKSGFLFPGFGYKDKLGFGVKNSYFWNLAPNYDLTFSGTVYSKQGFLSQAEWRHRLENGTYDLRIAGIHQQKPGEFNRNTVDANHKNRGMIASRGDFSINSRWNYGWNLLVQSDKNFSRTYDLDGYSQQTITNKIYLRGLGTRSYLDLNFYKFDIQEDSLKSSSSERDSKQPWVFPSMDYLYTSPEPVWGGEFNVISNLQLLYRESLYQNKKGTIDGNSLPRTPGLSGTSGRLTGEAEWKRSYFAPYGLVISPIFALRGDAIGYDAIGESVELDIKSHAFRAMATAGMELRWPILFSSTSSTHILEPVAQIFVRNNERYAGQLPNEDAQSFVFDATNLFTRDKFSGYDRVEGGTRANIGLRYSGNLSEQWALYGTAGQSFQLAGRNSFASPDLVNVGAESGLQNDVSDYVAMIGASHSRGLNLAARGRFDRKDFQIRRGEVELRQNWRAVSLGARYAFIGSQPEYGYTRNRQEVEINGSTKIAENWRAFGSGTYELTTDTLVRTTAGISYTDECLSYSMFYRQTRNPPREGQSKSTVAKPSHSVGFLISLRTLGDLGGDSSGGVTGGGPSNTGFTRGSCS